ncbi:FBX5 protein, partial [Amia calva]|nr:FBX5 protein [Amia calva]
MPCDASPSELRLPLLQFEHTVCKELRKSYSRTQKFDWTVVGKIAEDFGLQNVVGRKMGLEHVDLLQELMERNMRHILTRILRFLGDVDLINCQKVSKTWRRVICEDKWAVQMCTAAEERLQAARPTEVHATRDFALSRVVLSCIQGLASTPVPKPSKRSSPKECKPSRSWRSRHKDFQEAANVLKQHEALRHCTHCGSPAKYDSYLERATCTRVSCSFDFCTRCLCEYHSNATCTTGHKGQGSQTGLLAGSSRSKKNLKRL